MARAINEEIVLLVGHGGTASDMPRVHLEEFMKLERERRAKGVKTPSPREVEVDRIIRNWPRTSETDPYKHGIEVIADRLRARLGGREVAIAYNEFCAPGIDEAVDALVARGAKVVTVVTTMFTRGGIHSENEIPEIVTALKKRHAGVKIDYLWPYNVDLIADFIQSHLDGRLSAAS